MSALERGSLYGSDAATDAQQEAFLTGEIPVAVYGLGKMGLPLAAVFGEVTGNVVGADIDPEVVETVNDGDCHIKREPGLPELIAELSATDKLRAVSEPSVAAAEAALHVVIVPTPITEDKEPDLSILQAVTASIAEGLSPGDTVIVECTVPPGTTVGLVRKTLLEENGLEAGTFGLAFCPERTSSGRALQDIRGAYPKVVAGVDAESTRVARLVYEEINDKGVIEASDATTAEAVKLFEGLYRDVNIALANELGRFTDELGIDVREAIEIANTQPFCDIHDPGPGVGGHCIPFYPYFIIEPFETEAPLLRTAREVNDSMPNFTVEKILEGLNEINKPVTGADIAVLGLTYRPGVEEVRASPAIPIIEALNDVGSNVFAVDPLLDGIGNLDVEQIPLEKLYECSVDGVVIVTPHEDFDSIDWNALKREGDRLVIVDSRGTFDFAEESNWIYTVGSG